MGALGSSEAEREAKRGARGESADREGGAAAAGTVGEADEVEEAGNELTKSRSESDDTGELKPSVSRVN